MIRALALQSLGYQVTVTELTGWEHSLKNELILARRVHREHRGAREELRELLAATGIEPKIVRELKLSDGSAAEAASSTPAGAVPPPASGPAPGRSPSG